jgi:hypothetical protein
MGAFSNFGSWMMKKITLVAVLAAVALSATGCEVFGSELVASLF